MKFIIWFLPIFVLGCLASGYVGYEHGRQNVVTARAASAIMTLDALKSLKAGDTARAVGELENQCFMDSAEVLSAPGWRSDAFRKIEVPTLIAYRKSYCTNQAAWSPMEQRLEILLADKP